MVGDIVEVAFPFTDRSGEKRRPALVLADVGMGDWIVCEITSTGRDFTGDIPLTQNDMEHDGSLNHDSWLRPSRLNTLHGRLLAKRIGNVSDEKLAEVSAAVRGLFRDGA